MHIFWALPLASLEPDERAALISFYRCASKKDAASIANASRL